MFNTQQFEEELATTWMGRSFFYFNELGSTNSYSKSMSRVDTLHGALVLADDQFQGRGQYKREWEAKPGENLTFSLIFEPKNQKRLTVLTLACALAVADVCRDEVQSPVDIKWPNDILHKGKKICGILTEAIFNGNIIDRVIIGVGLNINQCDFSNELGKTATSLSIISGIKYSRERILSKFLSRFEYYYRFWESNDIELVRSINNRLLGFSKWVKLTVNDNILEDRFKFLGINENGALVVLNKELEVDTFSYEQVRITFD